MSAKVLPFAHTEFTWKRKIHRECRDDEREHLERGINWLYQWEDSLREVEEKKKEK